MLFNLWDKNLLWKNFTTLYNLTCSQMLDIVSKLRKNDTLDTVQIFCEEARITLDDFNVFDNLEFVGKIVSTTTDNLACLKNKGLLPIDVLLEHESPISRHLSEYQIKVVPSEHAFFYRGNYFYIPAPNEKCQKCAYGYNECTCEGSENSCQYIDAISQLAVTLYHDKSEIEMFLAAQNDEMQGYSHVVKYPEIFSTIEDFISKFFSKKLDIGYNWLNKKQYSYVITVTVRYEDMSFRSNYMDSSDDSDVTDEKFLKYKKFCSKSYDFVQELPKCFWDNIWLIDTCLDRLRYWDSTYIGLYAGIKHDIRIPYENLKIDLIES